MKNYIKIKFFFILLAPLTTFAHNMPCHMMKPVQAYIGPKISKFANYHGYSKAIYNSWIRKSQYLSLANGAKLAIDIIIPAKNCVKEKKPLPVILMQTPYQRVYSGPKGKPITQVEHHKLQTLIRHGYIFADFAIHGTAASFGIYHAIHQPVERENAYYVIEWLAKQTFSDGNIGMLGDSYQGDVQYLAASEHPPHLKAIFPETASFNFYDFIYPGGIFRQSLITFWEQLTHNMNFLNQLIPVDNDPNGVALSHARQQHKANVNVLEQLSKIPYTDTSTPRFSWQKNNPVQLLNKINSSHIPIYISDSWYDMFISDALFWYANYNGPKKMLIGAWPHNTYIAPKLVADERHKIDTTEELRWFDYWLKGIKNGIMKEDAVHYDVLKQDYLPNHFRSSNQWPPKHIKSIRLYLSHNNSLTTTSPAVILKPDKYQINYTTTTGHLSRWNNANGQGFINYSDLAYNDTKSLIYTTAPLQHTITLIGFPIMNLYLSASTDNVDAHIILEEVDKNGFSHYLTEGMLRASNRKLSKAPWKNYGLPFHSFTKTNFEYIKPKQVVILQFYLYPFSRIIHRGDKIRIAIMGADVGNTSTLTFPNGSTINVYHGKKYSSYLDLPA